MSLSPAGSKTDMTFQEKQSKGFHLISLIEFSDFLKNRDFFSYKINEIKIIHQ